MPGTVQEELAQTNESGILATEFELIARRNKVK
jgi:hypothetical protein